MALARHYSTKEFFRQMPNALLARYFQEHELLGDMDFSTMKEDEPDALFAAWQALPGDKRIAMDAEFREIFEVSCEEEFPAIIDEVKFLLSGDDFTAFSERMSALPNHYERAMVTFLDYYNYCKHFWSIGDLLYRKVSAGTLARTIKKHGIYAWDGCGWFGLTDKAGRTKAMHLLKRHYEWESTAPQERSNEDPRSPMDRWGCVEANPYEHFGWTSKVWRDIYSIERKQKGPDEKEETKPPKNRKPKEYFNHDLDWQIIADGIAAQIMTATRRVPTRREVAKKLVKELGKSVETIERRIRAEWK
jgi:hypothetical protein